MKNSEKQRGKEIIDEEIKIKTKKAKKKMERTVNEYKKFALKGNVIDLAIGVVIGGAFTNIINTLVNTTIVPIISVLTNKVDLSTLFISLSGIHYASLAEAKAAGAITFDYGTLLNALLNFFIISILLFIVVKYIEKIKKRTSKEEEIERKVTTKECPYCLSTIPIKATRCAHCTSLLEEGE